MKKIALFSSLILTLIIAGCAGGGSVSTPSADQASNPGYLLGSADAKVKIVEFSDYECPFCGRFHEDAFPQIKAKYIDTGLVSFEFKDFPLPSHSTARPAAEASYCAGELNGESTYWEMSSYLFENQDDLSKKSISTYAGDLGIDVAVFDTCTAERKYDDVITDNLEEGVRKGVTGTPSVFINDIKITGAQPFAVYEEVIDQLLES
jgi:protein-disulfide isomerase